MAEHDILRIAMACFVEGIDPTNLALAPGNLVRAHSIMVELVNDSETDGYYRCLDALSSSVGREQS